MKKRTKKGTIFLNILGFILISFLILGLFLFINEEAREFFQEELELKNEKEKQEDIQKLPELKNPKEVNFKWNYNSKEYELNLTLYGSTYNYYKERPKKYTCVGNCSSDWEEEYYDMFLTVPEEDKTFSELVSKLKKIGENNNLSDDQIVELTVSFVQSIPYDQAKAMKESPLARYPYEVLYEKEGICSGKSYLGALLVKELGYGVALFSFDKENHIVIGIECPLNYSSYNSGYCYTELTTPGWKIGIENLDDIEGIVSTSRTPRLIEAPQIYEIMTGKIYQGIYQTRVKIQNIKNLKDEIDKLEYEINILKEKLDYYERRKDYKAYNKLVSEYNNLISEHTKKIETYNNLIKEFSPKEE